MIAEWTDSKKWPNADRLAEMLSALGKIKPHSPEALAEALPELIAVMKVQAMGTADIYAAVHKITRYNEATHEAFGKQNELIRTLVTTVKAQDKLIRKL